MSEFSWAYIDADALISASGPTGSVQFRVGDAGGRSAISGSEKFMFHTASSTLRITGSVEISGTLTANQFNVNYIDKTVTNISASGDTKFGDTPDDIHQFTGSVFVSSSLVVNTGPPGADVNGVTTTTIDGTHISSSLNISGSGLYVTSADLTGDLNVGRFIYHAGDEDTKIEFTTDDIAISAGGREFIKMTEASTDTIEFNRINATNFKFIVNNSENEMLTIDDNSLVINEGGAPDDFRVESNQKQRAFYIDGDTQFVNILVDDDHVPHRTGSDTAVFISGTIGSRGTVIRGTSVFGGDVVISGSLHGGQGAGGTLPLDIGSDGLIVSGTAREATTTINGTHVSSSLNISGSAFYGNGADLSNIAKGSHTQIQFNELGALNGSDNLRFVSNQVRITGSLVVTGSAVKTGTTIDDTHISSSLDISGSNFHVGRFIRHAEDSDTYIDFTDDDINIQAGGVNFIDITQDSTNEITFNEEGADIDFRVEGSSDTHLLFTNGGTNKVGIGVVPDHKLTVNGDISASVNISGSGLYATSADLTGDLNIGRFIYHTGDEDTKIEFTTDKIAITAGGREFIQMQEASTDTLEINRLESSNFKFIINNSSNEMFTVDDDGIVINEGGAPDDFRVESNQKQRAFYIDGDTQFVHILVDEDHVPHRTGSDTAVFISGTIGSKGTAVRGTSVFGGDVVISGTLHGGSALDIGGDGLIVSGSARETTTTINGTHISSSLNISGSEFYGSGANLTNIPAGAVDAAGGTNQIQFNDDGDFGASANLEFRSNSALVLTGSLTVTGSGQSLIVLETRDADTLKEIVFNKDGSAAAAIQINSSEHMFIENENAKDIILRANNQNALRVIGSERKVIIGNVTRTAAHAELDVEGNAAISGTLAVSGSSTIGFDADDQSTFGGGLTASLGISLGEHSFVASDKNILFGSAGNSAIQYNNSAAQLIISGSSGTNGGINFQGNNIQFDVANGTVPSGSLAGAGSYLGLNSNGRLILTSSAAAGGGGSPADPDESIQFNNGGSFGGSEAFKFDSARSELELNGSMEVVSGSGAAERTVFAIDSTLTPGQSGSVRGRMLHTIIAMMDLTSGAQARTGRYVSLGPVTSASQTLTRNNGFISPFSGRLVSITYHFPAGATNQDQSKGQCGFALATADVNTLNGNTMDSAVNNTSFVTASTWPGTNRVGSINVQTGAGALGGLANVTGTFSFGTGSAVGLFFQSGDSSGVNFPGQCAFTIVFELDQIDQIASGSGGYVNG